MRTPLPPTSQALEEELAALHEQLRALVDAVNAAEAAATDAARRKEAAAQALREASQRTPALEQHYLDWKMAVSMTLDPHTPPSQSQAQLEEQIRALQAKMQQLQDEWVVRSPPPPSASPVPTPQPARVWSLYGAHRCASQLSHSGS
jgi:chromosome segregation ATPase